MKKSMTVFAVLFITGAPVFGQQNFDALSQPCATELVFDCMAETLAIAQRAVDGLSETEADQQIAAIALSLVNALDQTTIPEILERVALVVEALARLSVSPDQSAALIVIAGLVSTGQSVALAPDALLASAN